MLPQCGALIPEENEFLGDAVERAACVRHHFRKGSHELPRAVAPGVGTIGGSLECTAGKGFVELEIRCTAALVALADEGGEAFALPLHGCEASPC